ncbi:unnamed protein product [Rhodiola kirilowii]
MASSVRCGGGAGGTIRLKSDTSSSFSSARLPNLVPMKKFKSGSRPSISATVELSRVGSIDAAKKRDRDGCSRKIDHDTIHKWMPEAVVEIVKNLKQAPLLVQVYDKCDERSARLKMEKAVAEKWPKVKESWSGSGEAPEGVILVEELEEEEDETNKAWGVVIQGRGCEYGPACYLLKTTRVRSGLGAACTHFCLTKVTSFRESAFSQFTNCWLV